MAGVNPFGIIDYSGYLVDDFYYTYYPHDDCKHFDIYIGTKIKVTKYESINGFAKVILEDGKLVWIKEEYITKDIMYTEYQISDNSKKRYMDWECITDPASWQYKLQMNSYTSDNGIRMVGGRYCIAVGSYFTTDIGTKIDILLCSENGKLHTVRCILGDCKADIDTDSGNIYAIDGSIMEFIVNTSSLPEQARLHGDVSYASKDLTGRLISIKIYK